MSDLKEKLLKDLSDFVVDMEEEKVRETAIKFIENNFDASEAIEKGLTPGMERAGKLFEEEIYFIPELLICCDAMYAGLDVLKPHIKQSETNTNGKHKVVIGVVEGDMHDIGKDLVKTMLEAAGFEVIDLGVNVSANDFLEKAQEVDADFIALSTLLTSTMAGMEKLIELLKQENVRDKFKVLVGGGPVTQEFADKIGADGYAPNATEAAKLALSLV